MTVSVAQYIHSESTKIKNLSTKTTALSFLGFTFKGNKIRWTDRSFENFKHRIRELTKRSWGISMARRFGELRVYIQGWIHYFGLSEYYRPLPLLDEWLRRRIRMCYLKQWRKPRTRIRKLMALGVSIKPAISIGLSSKGPYRLAKTYATQMALNNQWLKDQGLVSIRKAWINLTILDEPPSADPHARWCGGWGLMTPGYPIRWHYSPQ